MAPDAAVSARKEAPARGVALSDEHVAELLLLVHGSKAGVAKLVDAFRAAHADVSKSSIERRIHALTHERAGIAEPWRALPDALDAHGARMDAHAAAVRSAGAEAPAHAICGPLEVRKAQRNKQHKPAVAAVQPTPERGAADAAGAGALNAANPPSRGEPATVPPPMAAAREPCAAPPLAPPALSLIHI